MKIQPVVEGHGEVEALPVLLRRLRDKAEVFELDVGCPIRRNLSDLLNEEGIQKAVRLALLQEDCGAVMVLLDSGDLCPKEKAGQLNQWARAAAGAKPCIVVLAHREYEAWFLASMEALRGKQGISLDATPPPEPEAIRGAKEALERHMPLNRSYSETVDQAHLTAHFDMKQAYVRCRSFRKLVKAFVELATGMGAKVSDLKPEDWE
jgi:hypothetical protein